MVERICITSFTGFVIEYGTRKKCQKNGTNDCTTQNECNNYRGISLLNSVYKIFSKVLLNRPTPYAEECLGEYQRGFRKGRSTIEQLSIIAQIIEKKYEYRQNMWQMFVDFRKAYDNIYTEIVSII